MKRWWRKRQLKSERRVLYEFRSRYLLAWRYEGSEWVRKAYLDNIHWIESEIHRVEAELDELR